MSPEAIFWTALTTLFSGLWITLSKVVAKRDLDPNINLMFGYGISLLITFTLFMHAGAELPHYYWTVASLAICGGIIYGASFLSRIQSLKYIDSVIFFPINKILGPIIVVSGSILIFGERLTTLQIFGVMLSICVPLLLINNQEKYRQNHLYLGVILMLISTSLGAINNFFPKTSMNIGATLLFYYVWQQLATFLLAFFYYLYIQHKGQKTFTLTRHEINIGLISGVFTFLTIYTWLRAMEVAPLSLLYTVHAHYILIPIIFSVIVYKEHIDFKKVCAVVLSMVAIAFLI